MTPTLPISIKARYIKARADHFAANYPAAFKDHGLPGVKIPDTRKSNGLTLFIINFLSWSGHRATRIAASGRLIDRPEQQASGVSLFTKKWIPGSTRKGSADISSTIKIGQHGISVMWEIKIGSDRPSEHQLAEQKREEAAGGRYFFVKTAQDFFYYYDGLFVSSP